MAERGAPWLLSLLCLTSLRTDTAAAKHGDKGKRVSSARASASPQLPDTAARVEAQKRELRGANRAVLNNFFTPGSLRPLLEL